MCPDQYSGYWHRFYRYVCGYSVVVGGRITQRHECSLDAFARRFKDEDAVLADPWWGRIARSFGGFTSLDLMVQRYIDIIEDDKLTGKVLVVLGKELLDAPAATPGTYSLPMQKLPERKAKAKM